MTPIDPEEEARAAQISADYAAIIRFHRYTCYCCLAVVVGVIVGLAYLQAKGGV